VRAGFSNGASDVESFCCASMRLLSSDDSRHVENCLVQPPLA
jgi:hypothetical protein